MLRLRNAVSRAVDGTHGATLHLYTLMFPCCSNRQLPPFATQPAVKPRCPAVKSKYSSPSGSSVQAVRSVHHQEQQVSTINMCRLAVKK